MENHPSRLWPMVQLLSREFGFDEGYAKALLLHNFPDLKNRDVCANCGASLKRYIFTFDVLDALLLQEMARDVRRRVREGETFQQANDVKVHDLPVSYATNSRTTQMRILGLIQKVRTPEGTHHPGHWLITKRGWFALGGGTVPKYAGSFRNKKIKDLPMEYEKETTMAEAMRDNKKAEYKDAIAEYNPSDWYDVLDMAQTKII